jgi:hypothetical protein
MLARIWNLIVGRFCRHNWRIVEIRSVHAAGGSKSKRVILQCEHCGDVKRRDL